MEVQMSTHNPETVIHLLRDHLAAHDKRLAFLFGAGTSTAVNSAPEVAPNEGPGYMPLVPAIAPMTEARNRAVDDLSSAHTTAWQLLTTECESLGKQPNIESILGRLRLNA